MCLADDMVISDVLPNALPCFMQAYKGAAKAAYNRAVSAAQVPNSQLNTIRPRIELLVDPAGLDESTERVILNVNNRSTPESIQEAKNKRVSLSYQAAAEAQAAAAAEEEEEGIEEDEEVEEDQADQDVDMADTDQAAPAAAAEAEPSAAAAAAAPVSSAADIGYVAHGRVAVLYASWKSTHMVDDYNWHVHKVATEQQKEAEGQKWQLATHCIACCPHWRATCSVANGHLHLLSFILLLMFLALCMLL